MHYLIDSGKPMKTGQIEATECSEEDCLDSREVNLGLFFLGSKADWVRFEAWPGHLDKS